MRRARVQAHKRLLQANRLRLIVGEETGQRQEQLPQPAGERHARLGLPAAEGERLRFAAACVDDAVAAGGKPGSIPTTRTPASLEGGADAAPLRPDPGR